MEARYSVMRPADFVIASVLSTFRSEVEDIL